MEETAKCSKCENVNKVLISTGHSKPENKGRKYFTCASCKTFQWVEGMATPQQVEDTAKGYDNEIVGKVKTCFIEAHIQKNGMVRLNEAELIVLDELVKIAMGK